MSPSDPPNVVVRIPRGVWWAALIALTGFLIKLSFSLEADLVKAQEQLGAQEARFKALEGRAFSCESRLDALQHRVERVEGELR